MTRSSHNKLTNRPPREQPADLLKGQQDVVAASLSFGVKQLDLGFLLFSTNITESRASKLSKPQNIPAQVVGDSDT